VSSDIYTAIENGRSTDIDIAISTAAIDANISLNFNCIADFDAIGKDKFSASLNPYRFPNIAKETMVY
jgi:hypothetical protein